MEILKRRVKREEYGNIEEGKEERGICKYEREEGRESNMGIGKI